MPKITTAAGPTGSGAPVAATTFAREDGVEVPVLPICYAAGAQNDYVWTSDANGNGSWAALPAATTSAQGTVVIDGTASDITALGALAAGSVGKPADAGHVHPGPDICTAEPGTLIASNFPAWGASTSAAPGQTAGSNGTLYFLKIYLPYAATITNLNFQVVTGGSGATVDAAYVGLCNSSGTVEASSANRSGDSALTTSNSLWTAPLSSPYLAAAGTYYAALLVYMNSGGTNPSFAECGGGRAGNAGQSAGAYPTSQLATQTSIAGPYTLSSNAATSLWFWVALS